MNSKISRYIHISLLILAGFIFAAGLQYVSAAWTNPTAHPPGDNVAAPVNTGTVDQIKDGALGVNTLAVFGESMFQGTLDMQDFRIVSLAEPVDATDAATKNYVDTSILEGGGDSVMYLRRAADEAPSNCPAEWTEVQYAPENTAGLDNENNTRVCINETSSCRVMYLRRSFSSEPVFCPSGWDDADFGGENAGNGALNMTRTCYVCN